MKIAVIGSSGRVGSRIVDELLRRGHEVTGIARQGRDAAALPGLTRKQADATEASSLAPALQGHDAVVSASRFLSSSATELVKAVKTAAVARLLVVGGAGSLEVAPGVMLYDTPEFPDKSKPESGAGIRFLETLKSEPELDWTFLSPSALFDPAGPRTGEFRLGGDALLYDQAGKSWISMDDYAIAMVDEIERPRHRRQRFCVGY